MSQFPDLDVLKEIPGYQAILKAVLKSQIQLLVEQLSKQTGEESVILTASVTDGTLCHLGSDSGKVFIDDHEEFKSQFLGFCIKRHHKRKAPEESPQRSGYDPGIPSLAKRRRSPEPYPVSSSSPIHPVGLSKAGAARNVAGQRRPPSHTESHPINTSQSSSYSQEQHMYPATDGVIKQESDSGALLGEDSGSRLMPGTPGGELEQPDDDGSSGDRAIVKTEPGEEEEDELEITGVELTNMSEGSQSGYEQWPSGAEGYGASTSGAEGQSFDGGNQSFSNSHSGDVQDLVASWAKEAQLKPKKPPRKKFTCEFCLKTFTRNYHLKIHHRIHTGEKPYSCEVCGRAFTVKSHLKSHHAVHIREYMTAYTKDKSQKPRVKGEETS